MVSVAEQFGNLRNTLGSILGLFALLRWLRSFFGRISGRPGTVNPGELTPSSFASFEARRGRSAGSQPPRPSRKPLLVFLVAVFGLPYLMGKLIKAIARAERRAAGMPDDEARQSLSSTTGQEDPRNVEFYRVLYDFDPATVNGAGRRGATSSMVDLAVKKGDLVAVLSKADPVGNPSEWWHCRTRDDRTGYLPSPYLAKIQLRSNVAISPPTVAGAGGSSTAPPGATTSGAPGSGATEPTQTPASVPTSQSSIPSSVPPNPVRPDSQVYTDTTNATGPTVSADAAATRNSSITITDKGAGVSVAGKSSDISAESFHNSPFALPRTDPSGANTSFPSSSSLLARARSRPSRSPLYPNNHPYRRY